MKKQASFFTGPMGKLGDVSFGYRLVAAVQDGDSFFKNVLDNRQVIHPSFQMVYKNTVVRLAFDYQHLEHIPNANNFLTPTGELYTGAGRDEAYFLKGTMEDFHRRGVRFIAIQKLSENWDMKIAATRWWFSRLGSVIFPDATLKIYLTASARHRAERRHKQLISKGNSATLKDIQQDLEARDARDTSRLVAPLKPAEHAKLLDNSDLSIEKSIHQVLDWWQSTRPF